VHLRRLIFLYVLVGWIVFVAVRIEWLNAAAGDLLPQFNAALSQNRAQGGSGKWRARWMNEEQWRAVNIRDAAGNPEARPLTGEERSRMAVEVERPNAYARLHDFISYFGWLLQYAAVFLALLVGGTWVMRYRRQPGLTLVYALPAADRCGRGGAGFLPWILHHCGDGDLNR
jgi:hypothetical protein